MPLPNFPLGRFTHHLHLAYAMNVSQERIPPMIANQIPLGARYLVQFRQECTLL